MDFLCVQERVYKFRFQFKFGRIVYEDQCLCISLLVYLNVLRL